MFNRLQEMVSRHKTIIDKICLSANNTQEGLQFLSKQ